MEIELKVNEIKGIMNLIEQNLIMLNDEDFNNVIEEYRTKKEMFVNLVDGIRNNTINSIDALLSLNTLTEIYNEFNANLCNNFNISATCLAAA